MRRVLGFLGLVALACGGAAVDHLRLGDEHYRAGRYGEAMAEYRTVLRADSDPGVSARLGAAALRAGELAVAVEAYQSLGLADPTRQQEAARGLERVIRVATRDGESGSAVLASAIVALRRVAPDRPLSRQALNPAGLTGLGQAEAVSVLPAALGSADRSSEVDRLLVEYARALEATTACDGAAEVYRTVLRRGSSPTLRAQARAGLAVCSLRLGLDAMDAGQPVRAEDWFITAIAVDTTGPVGFRARIGLGEARLTQGDVLGAAIWWQSVLSSPGVPDSLARLARERVNSLASAAPPPGGDGDA